MRGLFERSFGVEFVGAKLRPRADEGYDRVMQEPRAGAWVTAGEAVRLLRRDFPFKRRAYLRADPVLVGSMERFRGRVLVSWRGAQGSVELGRLMRLWPQALSVQYDRRWDEEVVEPGGVDVRDDLERLAALLSVCGRLVTVSTTVAHIAAALGVRVDLVIADRGTGRRNNLLPWKWWCEKTPGRSAWYGDNVRVYRGMAEYEQAVKDERRHAA